MTMPQDREAVAEEVAEQRKRDEEATAEMNKDPEEREDRASADQAAEQHNDPSVPQEGMAPAGSNVSTQPPAAPASPPPNTAPPA